jgi:hypothetical protein
LTARLSNTANPSATTFIHFVYNSASVILYFAALLISLTGSGITSPTFVLTLDILLGSVSFSYFSANVVSDLLFYLLWVEALHTVLLPSLSS